MFNKSFSISVEISFAQKTTTLFSFLIKSIFLLDAKDELSESDGRWPANIVTLE